jgi:hypothetical protein
VAAVLLAPLLAVAYHFGITLLRVFNRGRCSNPDRGETRGCPASDAPTIAVIAASSVPS